MNKVNAGFQIPVDFTESLYAVKRPQVDQFLLSMSEVTYTLQINLDSIVSRLTKTISTLQATGLQGDSLPTAVEKVIQQSEKHQVKAQVTDLGLYINPSLNTIIGFMLMFMMGLINNTVNHIMADRRQRTMARIYTAPVRAFEIMLGNFLGSFCVGTLQVLFILVFTRYVMGFDYHLPFLSHFIVLEFFLLACIGIASAVAGLIKNSRNISTINTLAMH
ncbi:ABC-2 family transporter protein [compost metagenome]